MPCEKDMLNAFFNFILASSTDKQILLNKKIVKQDSWQFANTSSACQGKLAYKRLQYAYRTKFYWI